MTKITHINERCASVSKQFLNKEAIFFSEHCSCCDSISALALEDLLDSGIDARYSYPVNGIVDYIELNNGVKFYLYHMWDEPITDDDYDRIFGKIEDVCGNYKMYVKKQSRY